MAKVKFFYADIKPIAIPQKKAIQQFVEQIFKREAMTLDYIHYVFCSDAYILEVNQNYLQHDYYTDIITFDLSAGNGIVGEVYVSEDTVRSNSVKELTKFSHEMTRVIFHGALHLCGYNDKTKSEITTMRTKEDYYLLSYFQNK